MQSSRYVGGLYGYAQDVEILIDSCMQQGSLQTVKYEDDKFTFAGGYGAVTESTQKGDYAPKLTTSSKSGYRIDTYNLTDEIYDQNAIKKDEQKEDDDRVIIKTKSDIYADYAGGLFGYIKSAHSLYGHIAEDGYFTNHGNTAYNEKLEDLKTDKNDPYRRFERYGKVLVTPYVNGYLYSGSVNVKGVIATSGIIAKLVSESDEVGELKNSLLPIKSTTLVLTNLKNRAYVGAGEYQSGEHGFVPNNSGASGIISEVKLVASLMFDNCGNEGIVDGRKVKSDNKDGITQTGSHAGGLIAHVSKYSKDTTDDKYRNVISNQNYQDQEKDGTIYAKYFNNFRFVEILKCTNSINSMVISGCEDPTKNVSVGGFIGYIEDQKDDGDKTGDEDYGQPYDATADTELYILESGSAGDIKLNIALKTDVNNDNDTNNYLNGAGGFAGYANVERLTIQDIRNNHPNINSGVNAGGYIGYLVNSLTEIKNSSNGAGVYSTGNSNTGAGGYIGQVSEKGGWQGAISNETNIFFVYATKSVNVAGTVWGYNAGGLVGKYEIGCTKLVIGDKLDGNAEYKVISINPAVVKGTVAGGVIGLIDGYYNGAMEESSFICNVKVLCGVVGTTAGGIIGKVAGNNQYLNLTIGDVNELPEIQTSVEGVIGDERTETAGGVIGYLKNIWGYKYGNIKIGNDLGSTTISASKNLGGVIGFVEDGEYTPSLADNVVLNYVGFIVNNYKPFNIWATDENGELLTEKVYNYSSYYVKIGENKYEPYSALTSMNIAEKLGTYSGATLDAINFGLNVGMFDKHDKMVFKGTYNSRTLLSTEDKILQDINVSIVVDKGNVTNVIDLPSGINISQTTPTSGRDYLEPFDEHTPKIDPENKPQSLGKDEVEKSYNADLDNIKNDMDSLKDKASKIQFYVVEVTKIEFNNAYGTWKLIEDSDLIFKAYYFDSSNSN